MSVFSVRYLHDNTKANTKSVRTTAPTSQIYLTFFFINEIFKTLIGMFL